MEALIRQSLYAPPDHAESEDAYAAAVRDARAEDVRTVVGAPGTSVYVGTWKPHNTARNIHAVDDGDGMFDSTHAFVYLHGNGSDLRNLGDTLLKLSRRTNSFVVAPEYPGYGFEGDAFPSEDGCYNAARAAYAFVRDELQFPPSRIIVFGRSLGTAVACQLASEQQEIAGVILQSAFNTAVRSRSDAFMRKLLGWLPLGMWAVPRTESPVTGTRRARVVSGSPVKWPRALDCFVSAEKVAGTAMPFLMIHGTHDAVIPLSCAEDLARVLRQRPRARDDAYARAVVEQVTFQMVPGAGHNDVRKVQKRLDMDDDIDLPGGVTYMGWITTFMGDSARHADARLGAPGARASAGLPAYDDGAGSAGARKRKEAEADAMLRADASAPPAGDARAPSPSFSDSSTAGLEYPALPAGVVPYAPPQIATETNKCGGVEIGVS